MFLFNLSRQQTSTNHLNGFLRHDLQGRPLVKYLNLETGINNPMHADFYIFRDAYNIFDLPSVGRNYFDVCYLRKILLSS